MKRKVARGSVRKILVEIGRIQDLVGRARGLYMDDRNPNTADQIIPVFDEMLEICIAVLGEYERIKERPARVGGEE